MLGEDGKVKAIRVEKTTTSADGRMSFGEFEEYPVQAVYHAIGYKPATTPGITYDERRAHLANANGDGRITTEASGEGAQVRERLYATGWAKRGPVGLIGSTKSDALLIVTNMLEDLSKAAEGGRVAADRDPESIDRLLASPRCQADRLRRLEEGRCVRTCRRREGRPRAQEGHRPGADARAGACLNRAGWN